MMMSPAQYAEQFKNSPYLELLKVKKDLITSISEFEHDYDMDFQDWNVCPGPDVQYQWNLEVLGLIAPMLAEAFNKEYARGIPGYPSGIRAAVTHFARRSSSSLAFGSLRWTLRGAP